MANLSLTRVNQKLTQAKLLLQREDEAALSPVHRNAILEGAAFHLVCAHQHYLRELAENYGVKNVVAVQSEQDLIAAFDTVKKYAVEALELSGLRKQPTSWLSQLQAYYDSLWRIPVRSEGQQGDNLIRLVDADTVNQPEIDFELVRSWQSQFAALVVRQRETSAEF